MQLIRLEGKLLAANARFEHQAAHAHGEDGDAIVVVCRLRSALFESSGRCTCRNLVVATLELIERGSVLEENDLTIGLTAELQADGELGHAAGADGGATLEDGAVASSTADDDSAFGDFGKDGVAISRAEEGVDARIRRLERLDRIARPLFVGRIRTRYGATNHEDWQARNDKT